MLLQVGAGVSVKPTGLPVYLDLLRLVLTSAVCLELSTDELLALDLIQCGLGETDHDVEPSGELTISVGI